jgi:hypothetical protein
LASNAGSPNWLTGADTQKEFKHAAAVQTPVKSSMYHVQAGQTQTGEVAAPVLSRARTEALESILDNCRGCSWLAGLVVTLKVCACFSRWPNCSLLYIQILCSSLGSNRREHMLLCLVEATFGVQTSVENADCRLWCGKLTMLVSC